MKESQNQKRGNKKLHKHLSSDIKTQLHGIFSLLHSQQTKRVEEAKKKKSYLSCLAPPAPLTDVKEGGASSKHLGSDVIVRSYIFSFRRFSLFPSFAPECLAKSRERSLILTRTSLPKKTVGFVT